MRLELLAASDVDRAVEIYMRQAWPPGCGERPRVPHEELLAARTLPEKLARFEREHEDDVACLRRFTVRLGNFRYPFMKFVVQEYLVNGEFFFSVDTHDNLEIRPDAVDYEAWEALKRHNRGLKRSIEEEWNRAGLPTNEDLRTLMEGLATQERAAGARGRVLIVDDEIHVAHGLKALLEARGFEVELAHDGRAALDRLAREPRPDLLLLDNDMPELDGEEVLARMRREPRLEDLPVLMATASSIELDRLQRVSGFLRKPYPRDVLFAMIDRLLGAERGAPGVPGVLGGRETMRAIASERKNEPGRERGPEPGPEPTE